MILSSYYRRMTHGDMDVLERIIKLEVKLASTIEKLDTLIDSMETRYNSLTAKFDGDHITPSMHSRVMQLEEFKSTVKWTVGILYTAVIGLVIELILHKLKG